MKIGTTAAIIALCGITSTLAFVIPGSATGHKEIGPTWGCPDCEDITGKELEYWGNPNSSHVKNEFEKIPGRGELMSWYAPGRSKRSEPESSKDERSEPESSKDERSELETSNDKHSLSRRNLLDDCANERVVERLSAQVDKLKQDLNDLRVERSAERVGIRTMEEQVKAHAKALEKLELQMRQDAH